MERNKKYIYIFSAVFIIIGIFVLLQQRERVNIILIVIDGLRPDHLGCYGYQRNTSPNIDRLSTEGVSFTQAITAGGWTVESVPSILTGTYPFTHQVRNLNNLRNPSINTLAGELKVKGYQCALFSNHYTIELLDIKDDFQEVYISREHDNGQPVINDHLFTIGIIDWLKMHKNRDFFLYIHYHGPHIPYRPPQPYKNMFRYDEFRDSPKIVPISDITLRHRYYGVGVIPYVTVEDGISDSNYYISQYDGTIAYTDAQIGQLIDSLKKLGLDKNTLIILTADHGEMLGEHNIYFNHQGCYEGNIRVPLMIRFPKLFPGGMIFSRQVSLIDIAPTILEAIGLDEPSYMQGESLLAFIKPSRTYQTKYAFTCFFSYSSLRTENWKLITNGFEWNLYNLNKDSREQDNLIDKEPYKFRELKEVFENWREDVVSPMPAKKGPPLTEEDKQHLRSLGYIQ